MQDIVFDIVRQLQERSDISFYGEIHIDGDTEEPILVLTSANEVDVLSEMFKEVLKIDEDFYPTYSNASLDYVCDGDRNWAFDCDGDWCSGCNKWFHYDYYGASGYSRFFTGDGYRLCNNCVKEDNEGYFNSLIDASEHANTIFDDKELHELGWEKVNKEPWANGLYGQFDNPKKILQKAKSEDANAQYIFSIVKNYNPYETEFDLWKRRAV